MEDEEELAYARAREQVPLHPPGAQWQGWGGV